MDDEEDRTGALVRVDDTGRVVGVEVLQHATLPTRHTRSAEWPGGPRRLPALRPPDRPAGPGAVGTVGVPRVATLLTHTHGRHHPHLSYAVLRDGDPDSVRTALSPLADGAAVDVTAQGSVCLPRGRIALACAASRRRRGAAGARRRFSARGRPGAPPQLRTGSVGPARLGRDQRRSRPGIAGGRRGVGRAAAPLHADRAAVIETGTGQMWPCGVPRPSDHLDTVGSWWSTNTPTCAGPGSTTSTCVSPTCGASTSRTSA